MNIRIIIIIFIVVLIVFVGAYWYINNLNYLQTDNSSYTGNNIYQSNTNGEKGIISSWDAFENISNYFSKTPSDSVIEDSVKLVDYGVNNF